MIIINEDLHIGTEIKNKMELLVQTQKLEVYKHFDYKHVNSFYLVYKQKHLNTDILQKFCKALNFNFFSLFLIDTAEPSKKEKIVFEQRIKELIAENESKSEMIRVLKEQNEVYGKMLKL